MKYTNQERMDIGCRIYSNELTKREAMEKFGISATTVDNYIRLYRTENNLPPRGCRDNPLKSRTVLPQSSGKYEEFNSMSREERIGEIIKARINELRVKKGYTVKGDKLVAHALSAKRGDRMTYINGLNDVLELKAKYPELKRFFIRIRVRYIHQKRSMIYFRCIALSVQCHAPERRRIMLQWKRSTAG